jgi:hypothetical protein
MNETRIKCYYSVTSLYLQDFIRIVSDFKVVTMMPSEGIIYKHVWLAIADKYSGPVFSVINIYTFSILGFFDDGMFVLSS